MCDRSKFSLLSSLPTFSSFSSNVKGKLIDATLGGRAILLLEITDAVFQRYLNISGDDLHKISRLKTEAAAATAGEVSAKDRYFERPFAIIPGYDLISSIKMHKPSRWMVSRERKDSKSVEWSWLEYIAAGGAVSFTLLAEIFDQVFREAEFIENARKSGYILASFKQRCEASGFNISFPLEFDQSISGKKEAFRKTDDYLPPREQIKRTRTSSITTDTYSSWQFTGILQAETRIRLELASVSGSWDSTRSA